MRSELICAAVKRESVTADVVQKSVRGEVGTVASDQIPQQKFRLRDDGVKTSACRG